MATIVSTLQYIAARAAEPGTHKALVGGLVAASTAWVGGAPGWAVGLAFFSPWLNVVYPDSAPIWSVILGRWGVTVPAQETKQ